METKPKICKGINKAKGIKGCGKISNNRTFGLCASCLWDWAHNNDNGKIWYKKQFAPRVKKVEEKRIKKENAEFKESLKSISRLINDARRPFQEFIRLRDINESCISCGDVNAKIWHAGHYLKAELYTGLIFEEKNCSKQCEKCNTFLNGNEAAYRIGLVEKYGEDNISMLETYADTMRSYKFTREELKNIKEYYLKKVRELKKQYQNEN